MFPFSIAIIFIEKKNVIKSQNVSLLSIQTEKIREMCVLDFGVPSSCGLSLSPSLSLSLSFCMYVCMYVCNDWQLFCI